MGIIHFAQLAVKFCSTCFHMQLVTTYLLEGIRMTVPGGTYTDCTEMLYSSTHFFDNFNHSVECHEWRIPPSLWMTTTSIIPTLILIPLVDRLLYVSCRPKMLKRIAAGKVFLLLSIVVAIPVEIVRLTQLWDQFDNEENNSTIIINAIPFHTKSSMTFHVASPLSIAFIMPQYILFGFTVVLAKITGLNTNPNQALSLYLFLYLLMQLWSSSTLRVQEP